MRAAWISQGEADSRYPERAQVYEVRLVDLVRHFRAEFDAPDLPFFVGQLGHFDSRPWDENKKLVDAAHRRIPSLLSNVYFVSAEGLTDSDGVHFDSPSARELGRRYAEAWLASERAD